MLRKLDSAKEQDSQNHLQNDPAILATLMSLCCMLPIRHMPAKISQWQLEMSD
jgi:hypothetical protein